MGVPAIPGRPGAFVILRPPEGVRAAARVASRPAGNAAPAPVVCTRTRPYGREIPERARGGTRNDIGANATRGCFVHLK